MSYKLIVPNITRKNCVKYFYKIRKNCVLVLRILIFCGIIILVIQ